MTGWNLVTVMQSPSVNLPDEVTGPARTVLLQMGWTPPPEASETQDPTEGLFLCAEETP